MNPITAFGVVAIFIMLILYSLEPRGRWYVFAFGVSCLGGALYGFLSKAWPFGVAEVFWAGVAFHRWWKAR